jgi:hypothetical protein
MRISATADTPYRARATIRASAATRERSDDEQRDDEHLRPRTAFHACDDERAQNAHADECGDSGDAQQHRHRELSPPRADETCECHDRRTPAHRFCVGVDVALRESRLVVILRIVRKLRDEISLLVDCVLRPR